MELKVAIKNYRQIENAEIVLNPIALVGGNNNAGKTSICQAVAAALMQNAVPVKGVLKKNASLLLRNNTSRGKCMVSIGENSITANWPGGAITESVGAGESAPFASGIACGLVNIADMDQKDVAPILNRLLKVAPTLEELTAELKEHIDPETINKVWGVIDGEGWDAAFKKAKESGIKRKGNWESITGIQYGEAKAANWRHPKCPESVEGLEKKLAADTKALEKAIANKAVGAAKIEDWKTQKKAGEVAAPKHAELTEKWASLEVSIDKLREKIAALPLPDHEVTLDDCPHCGKSVWVDGLSVLMPPKTLSKRENESRAQAIAIAKTELPKLVEEKQAVSESMQSLKMAMVMGKSAEDLLKNAKKEGTTEADVQAARDAVDETRAIMQAAQDSADAETLHIAIINGQFLIDTLSPLGLRQTVMRREIGALNARFSHLAATASWPEVKMHEDLSITTDNFPYLLLSKSNQFMTEVIVQIALAELDHSDAIIIDGADILDPVNRNGLFSLLAEVNMPTLVTMTLPKKENVPNLKTAGAGLGQSYWLAESILWPAYT